MISVSVILMPGDGQTDVVLPVGSTLADLASRFTDASGASRLAGRKLVLDGEEIADSAWGQVVLTSGAEVGAIGLTKGN